MLRFNANASYSNSTWRMFLFWFAMMLSWAAVLCFDPCPESMRGSNAAKLPEIPDEEIEKAFHHAEKVLEKRKQLELKLIQEGRTIPRTAITAESVHQPILFTTPMSRDGEMKQLMFEEASRRLTKKYKLNAAQVSCGLPKLPLRTPTAKRALEMCTANVSTHIHCDVHSKYRTQDGTCNNLKNPFWGSALDCVERLLLPKYTGYSRFRRSVGRKELPPPRTVSLNVHGNVNKSEPHITHMVMFYGQLLAHDLTATAVSTTEGAQAIQCCPQIQNNHPRCAPIDLQDGDPFYSQFQQTCFNFVRSASCRYCTLGPRCQLDSITAFIDASVVYGSSLRELNATRNYDGTGTLKVQTTEAGDLLPQSFDPSIDRCSHPAKNKICFQSGDGRVNQHPVLASLHTLFHREHNRIARNLSALNPDWDDETVFQEARKILGAMLQVITYKEFLLLILGKEQMSAYNLGIEEETTAYNPDLNPTLFTEFSTATLRVGHSLINSILEEDPSKPGHSSHLLRDVFVYPFDLYTGEMDPLLRGATQSVANKFNRHIVPDVTDFLYRVRGTPAGLDLVSINLQRGRDHGLQPYTAYAQLCAPKKIQIRSFDDLLRNGLMTSSNVFVLRNTYRHVEDIDLFTGLVSEIPNKYGVVGPTAACILGLQFQRLKFGDRFFFQNTGHPGAFTSEQIRELKKTSLAKVLCDNTEITEMQQHAMTFPTADNPKVPCSQIPGINLEKWKKQS